MGTYTNNLGLMLLLSFRAVTEHLSTPSNQHAEFSKVVVFIVFITVLDYRNAYLESVTFKRFVNKK